MARTFYKPNRVPRELNQGGTSSTETVFTSDGTLPVICNIPQNLLGPNTTTGRQYLPFNITVGGRVTGGTTTNYTPKLYFGTSTTTGSDTAIGTGAAVAVNSNSGAWRIEFSGVMIVTGTAAIRIEGHFRNTTWGSTRTFTADAISTTTVTAQDNTSTTALGFVVSGTFSSGNAGNAAYIDEFILEVCE